VSLRPLDKKVGITEILSHEIPVHPIHEGSLFAGTILIKGRLNPKHKINVFWVNLLGDKSSVDPNLADD
jgi:hypothetical protein